MNTMNDFDKQFAQALSAAPDVPDCYPEIVRRIKRGNTVRVALRSVAALVAISLTSFVFIGHHSRERVAPEVVEELQSIYSNVSGEDIGEEMVSCSLIGEDSY